MRLLKTKFLRFLQMANTAKGREISISLYLKRPLQGILSSLFFAALSRFIRNKPLRRSPNLGALLLSLLLMVSSTIFMSTAQFDDLYRMIDATSAYPSITSLEYNHGEKVQEE